MIDLTIETLRWLGLDWDSGPEIQSEDLSPYIAGMESLASRRLIFPCSLSRSEIEQALSAPNEGTHESRYDPKLRPNEFPREFNDQGKNWRLLVAPGRVHFSDRFAGEQAVDVAASVGDFLVWTKRGFPSYQLAVVIDDAAIGVTDIVRGNDLIDSAGRQIMLMRAIGIEHIPEYTHLPLVRGEDGRRLAKRHGDTRIAHYRAQGASAERIIGLIGYWCRLTPTRQSMSLEEFRSGFSLDTLPRTDLVFSGEDDEWLTH